MHVKSPAMAGRSRLLRQCTATRFMPNWCASAISGPTTSLFLAARCSDGAGGRAVDPHRLNDRLRGAPRPNRPRAAVIEHAHVAKRGLSRGGNPPRTVRRLFGTSTLRRPDKVSRTPNRSPGAAERNGPRRQRPAASCSTPVRRATTHRGSRIDDRLIRSRAVTSGPAQAPCDLDAATGLRQRPGSGATVD